MIEVKLWTERFAEALKIQHFSEETIRRYSNSLKPFLVFLNDQGLTTVAGLTRQHVQGYQTQLYYAKFQGRSLKASTQRNRLSVVLTFVRFLVRHDYLLVDITQGVDLPRPGETLPRVVLSESETLRLLEAPDVSRVLGVRDRAILEVFYATGLRNRELRSLNLDDLDEAQGLVRVLQGKGNKSRWVPMGEEAWLWLEEYLRWARPQLAREHSGQTVFLGRMGRKFLSSDLRMVVVTHARRAGLEKPIGPHCLRHTCATHMLKHGAGLRHLQVMLGHSKVSTTQVYTRVELSDLRKVLQRCHPRERLKP